MVEGLRVDGVPRKEKETADDVLKRVKIEIVKSASDVLDEHIGLAALMKKTTHRIGRTYEENNYRIGRTYEENNSKFQSIIVRFTTFRHRTLFYRNRKNLKSNVKIKLDLTTHLYNLLKVARNRHVHERNVVKFVYAYINCRLKARFSDDIVQVFDSLKELDRLISMHKD